jgi:hypothetical protein
MIRMRWRSMRRLSTGALMPKMILSHRCVRVCVCARAPERVCAVVRVCMRMYVGDDYLRPTPSPQPPRHRAQKMVDVLCDLGAEVDLRTSTNRTALHWAVDINNVAVARRLIQRGADINARTGFQDDTWYTPLTWAARQGSKEMLDLLLGMGADVFARCQDQRTALWWAEMNGFDDIADLLRKYGVADRAPIQDVLFEHEIDAFASATGTEPP